jgi:hypothetical protein
VCKIAPDLRPLRKLAHLFSPQTLKGDPAPPRRCGACGRAASSRFLIVGPLATPNRNRPPAARHFVLFRPTAGAPRRLRQRSACHRVERYAHDRTAVVVVVVFFVFVRAVFTCNRAITGRACCWGFVLLVVLPLYTLYILLYAIRYKLLGVVDTISIMILGDGTVRCLATILPGPALSSSHFGPWVWVGGA